MDGRRSYVRLRHSNLPYFPICFCDNLLNSDKHSKIQNKTKLNKKTIETLLNKLFVLDNQEQNETVINEYADKRCITTT